jgi:hypothetical protein
MLGGLTTASFISGSVAPGAFANSNSFSLPAGTYVIVFLPTVRPGFTSTATFAQINYSVSTLINNGGTQFFITNVAISRTTMIDGTGASYDNFQYINIFTLPTAQATLYACVQLNYTPGGASQAVRLDATTPGQASIYRIA